LSNLHSWVTGAGQGADLGPDLELAGVIGGPASISPSFNQIPRTVKPGGGKLSRFPLLPGHTSLTIT